MSIGLRSIPYEKMEFQMFVIEEMCDTMEQQGREIIRLTLGKSELPLAESIKNIFCEKIFDIKQSLLVYPQGIPGLRAAIAEHYQSKGLNISPEQIIVNSGTSPLIKNLLNMLLDNSDEVLLPHPYYPLYLISSLLSNARIKFYNINLNDGRIDLRSFSNNFSSKHTKLVFLNSPGNPLGNIINQDDMVKILEIVDNNAYILSDEIYMNVLFDERVTSILSFMNGNKNVIVSNGFSKAFRMYTKRVGFFILPESLIFPFRVLNQHTLLTVDPVTQYACIEALHREQDCCELVALYKERRNYTIEKLKGIKQIDLLIPEGGFYFTINCQRYMEQYFFKSSQELAIDILDKIGVGTVPGSDFGIEGTIRLSFTNTRYKEAIDLLEVYFTK